MKKVRNNPKTIIRFDFPEEVIEDILYRLPIKSLLKCISVCKSWYSLIKNPNFVSTHLRKALNSSNNNPLFLHRPHSFNINLRYKLYFDNKDFEEYMSLELPSRSDTNNRPYVHFASSCNGLVCLFHNDFSYGELGYYRFILWNPSIRKCVLLPLSHLIDSRDHTLFNFIGFGFDSRTHDYKILRIMNDGSISCKTELYSLNANSWKNITDIAPKHSVYEHDVPVLVNGALHWIVTDRINHKHRDFIMVFDVGDETFREIMLPECLADAYLVKLAVMVFGESSIAVVYQDRNDGKKSHVWAMREYGIVTSWKFLGTVGKHWRGKSKVLGFRNNGDVLLEFRRGTGSIASQNIQSQRIKTFTATDKSSIFRSSIHSYVESLVLLDKPSNVLDATNASS